MRQRSIILVLATLLVASSIYALHLSQLPCEDVTIAYQMLERADIVMNSKQHEYQFDISDEGYVIYTHGRFLGTIPIDDSALTPMDSLMIKSNL